ncbi:MAG: hypothetical protein ACYSU7_16330 [Planctomycetota bacterium]|jgi:hypothetical protein
MTSSPPATGLAALDQVELSAEDSASARATGGGTWLTRKLHEARQFLALAQVAGPQRMDVRLLDLRDELRAVFRLTVPVAMTPAIDGALRVADEAVLGLMYPEIGLSTPMPGFLPVCLLSPPADAWYANVGTVNGQRLCLGASLPAGIPVTELVLLSYGLLSMQSVMLDPDDSAGVMNPEAAVWWQGRIDLLPLSSEAFLKEERK